MQGWQSVFGTKNSSLRSIGHILASSRNTYSDWIELYTLLVIHSWPLVNSHSYSRVNNEWLTYLESIVSNNKVVQQTEHVIIFSYHINNIRKYRLKIIVLTNDCLKCFSQWIVIFMTFGLTIPSALLCYKQCFAENAKMLVNK